MFHLCGKEVVVAGCQAAKVSFAQEEGRTPK